jgi:small-conductance mechanosensitive channel
MSPETQPAQDRKAPPAEKKASADRKDASDKKDASEKKDSSDRKDAADGKDASADAPAAKEVDPWESVWTGQKERLNDIAAVAANLRKKVADDTSGLARKSGPYEEESKRLLVLANTFRDWPNPLEAVSRRIGDSITNTRKLIEPVVQGRDDVQGLLDRVTQLSENLPEEVRKGKVSADLQAYVKDIGQAKSRLAAVIAQYDNALAPFLTLIDRMQKAREEISKRIPLLWTAYYLQSPVPYLNIETWQDIDRRIENFGKSMRLRLSVELPTTAEQWTTAGLRFAACLVLSGIICLMLYRRFGQGESGPATAHLYMRSLPWLCVGFAFISSSISAEGEFFRFLLGIGNLFLIFGQLSLAWDLRILQHPEETMARSPLVQFMPLTCWAYVLLYLPIAQPIALVLWALAVGANLLRIHRHPPARPSVLTLEQGVLDIHSVVLWICLLLAVLGLHIYSMALYMTFVSCSLALELCISGIARIGRLHESLPKEGMHAALGSLAIALAAPLVIVLAVFGVLLWIGTLPGGIDILRHYGFQGFNIGNTQFNVIQVLLIFSAFYITRTAVAMGTRFLSRLPAKDMQLDTTLIPPMQTAFTYALWCVFGLFALHALGMELSSLAMVAGGLSVGIGFGMQTIVNNFISGLILIFSRTLQAGDVVEVGGTIGRVRKISVRATMVETYDNALIYVPNSEFVSSRLVNWTRNSRSVRRDLTVGVAYGTSPPEVMGLLLGIAKSHGNVLKYPAPSVLFSDFGASTLDFILRFWVRDYDVSVSTASDLRIEIEKVFREKNIEIAFPQLDVHIKDDGPSRTPEASGRHRPPRRPRRRPSPGAGTATGEGTSPTKTAAALAGA